MYKIVDGVLQVDSLQIDGWLNLSGSTELTSLPDNLWVDQSLDLRGCAGLIALPESLSVGSLYLQGCTGLPFLVRNAGRMERDIACWHHKERGVVISLGCFIGTKDQAIQAVKRKYSGDAASDYVAKIEIAFALYAKWREENGRPKLNF